MRFWKKTTSTVEQTNAPAPVPVTPVRRPLTQRAVFPWLVVLVIFVALLLVFSPVVFIQSGHRGVATFFGDTQGDVYSEGAHFKYPLLRVHQLDVRTQNVAVSTGVTTSDSQLAQVVAATQYRLDTAEVRDIYEDVGMDIERVIVEPAVKEATGAAAAQFTAAELISRRNEFRDAIRADLATRLGERGVIVEGVTLESVEYSQALQEMFEARAVTEQKEAEAEAAHQAELKQIEREIIEARFETERIKILGEALRDNEAFVLYEMVRKWDGTTPLSLGSILPAVQVFTQSEE